MITVIQNKRNIFNRPYGSFIVYKFPVSFCIYEKSIQLPRPRNDYLLANLRFFSRFFYNWLYSLSPEQKELYTNNTSNTIVPRNSKGLSYFVNTAINRKKQIERCKKRFHKIEETLGIVCVICYEALSKYPKTKRCLQCKRNDIHKRCDRTSFCPLCRYKK